MIFVLPWWVHRFIYFGWETDLDDEAKNGPIAQNFWFLEDTPPYSKGSGWRFRITYNLALHIGRGKHRTNVSSHEESLGGSSLNVDPTDIANWGINADIHEAEPADASKDAEGRQEEDQEGQDPSHGVPHPDPGD